MFVGSDLYYTPFSQLYASPTQIIDSNRTLWSYSKNSATKTDTSSRVEQVYSAVNTCYVIDEDKIVWQKINSDKEFTPIKSLPEIKSMAVGNFCKLFLDLEGNVWHTTPKDPVPEKLQGLPPIQMVTTSTSEKKNALGHSLLLDYDGVVWGRGDNDVGQLGLGIKPWIRDQSCPLPNLPPIASVSTSGSHSLLLDVKGNVYAAGSNINGQLGMWDVKYNMRAHEPQKIDFLPPIDKLKAGLEYSLLIDCEKRLWGTGKNTRGQLGNNTKESLCNPQIIQDNCLHVHAHYDTTILKTDGSLWQTGPGANGNLLTQMDFHDAMLPSRGKKLKSARKVVSNN